MKISAVNMHSNTNFNGLLVKKSSSSNDYNYYGTPSGNNYSGLYSGSEEYESYIYYPFLWETKAHIDEQLKENNYEKNFPAKQNGEVEVSYIRDTRLGKTLPFTEKEWQAYSEDIKNKFLKLL